MLSSRLKLVLAVAIPLAQLGLTVGCASSGSRTGLLSSLRGRRNTTASDDRDDSYAEAKRTLRNPERTYISYAQWKEDIGQIVEARQSYESVLADSPKNIDALLGLARCDQLTGRVEEAEQRFQQAYQRDPQNQRVLHSFGQFYSSQDRMDEAVAMLNSAVLVDPAVDQCRYDLAIALARSGRTEEAMPHFTRTVGDAEAYYNVGHIQYEQGDVAAAERNFLQAIIRKPTLTHAQQMLDELRNHPATELADRSTQRGPSAAPVSGSRTQDTASAGRGSLQRIGGQSTPTVRNSEQRPGIDDFALRSATMTRDVGSTTTERSFESRAGTVPGPAGYGHSPVSTENGFASPRTSAATPRAEYGDRNAQTLRQSGVNDRSSSLAFDPDSLTPQQLEQLRNQDAF